MSAKILPFGPAAARRRSRRERDNIGAVPLYRLPTGDRAHAVRHGVQTPDGRTVVTMRCGAIVRLRRGYTLPLADDPDVAVCARCARSCITPGVP